MKVIVNLEVAQLVARKYIELNAKLSSMALEVDRMRGYISSLISDVAVEGLDYKKDKLMNIKEKRIQAKMTEGELAEKMGVSQANVSQWESGKATPTADKLPQLANILGCTIDELFKN